MDVKLKVLYFDSLIDQIEQLKGQNNSLSAENSQLESEVTECHANITNLQQQISNIQNIPDQSMYQQPIRSNSPYDPYPQHDSAAAILQQMIPITQPQQQFPLSTYRDSNGILQLQYTSMFPVQNVITSGILFSEDRRSSSLSLSRDRKIVRTQGQSTERNILGSHPLLPGNVYQWTVRYKGRPFFLRVGVIDENKFRADGSCARHGHCFRNDNAIYGSLTGSRCQWNPEELLAITADMNTNTVSINSVGHSGIALTGSLRRLRGRYYYPFFKLHWADTEIEIVS
ncbi:hypothetical protein GEMRC1_001373 [Eukaryota sp. GEM-RC1]